MSLGSPSLISLCVCCLYDERISHAAMIFRTGVSLLVVTLTIINRKNLPAAPLMFHVSGSCISQSAGR